MAVCELYATTNAVMRKPSLQLVNIPIGRLQAQSCPERATARLFHGSTAVQPPEATARPPCARGAHTRAATSPGARARAGALARVSFLWLTWRVKDSA